MRAEAAAALAAGQLPRGEAPYGFALADTASGMSKARAQVVAEAREAQRLGVLGGGEQSIVISAQQAEQIRAAGLRAISDMPVAAKS